MAKTPMRMSASQINWKSKFYQSFWSVILLTNLNLQQNDFALKGDSGRKCDGKRCFQNKKISIFYKVTENSWMARTIFLNWLWPCNANTKKCLFIDDSPIHPPKINLTNIEFVYLPANTTVIAPASRWQNCALSESSLYYRKQLMKELILWLNYGQHENIKNLSVF